MTHKAFLLAVLLVVGYALVGCDGGGGPDPKEAAAKAARAKTGSTPHPGKIRSGREGD
jgi:hypothetical protein